jgi:hypothetical protein
MPNDHKPTVEHINDYHEHFNTIWSDSRRKWEKYDTDYTLDYEIFPKNLERDSYYPSTAKAIVDTAVDNQMAFEPRIHRNPQGEGDAHKLSASRIESGLSAISEDAMSHEPVHPYKLYGRYMLHLGYVVGEITMDLLDLPEPSVSKYWNPIRIKSPHPSRVLMDPGDMQPSEALKVTMMYVKDLEAIGKIKKEQGRIVDLSFLDGLGRYERVETHHYWNLGYHAMKIKGDDSLMWLEDNVWGINPFDHVYAGFGMERTGTPDFKPDYFADGMLEGIHDEIVAQAQGRSAKHNLLLVHSYAKTLTQGDAAELAEKLQGDIVGDTDPRDLDIMKTPQLTAGLFEAGNEVDRALEYTTGTAAISGQRQEGVITVGQQAQLDNSGRRRFAGPQHQLEKLVSSQMSKTLRLVEVLKETYKFTSIGAGGYEVKVSDIYNSYKVDASFEVLDPAIEMSRRQLLLQELGAGIIDTETYYEETRRENTSQIRQRLKEDAYRKHPIIVTRHAALTAREFNDADTADILDAQADQLQAEVEQSVGLDQSVAPPDGNGIAAPPGGNGIAAPPGGNGTTPNFRPRQSISDTVPGQPRSPQLG